MHSNLVHLGFLDFISLQSNGIVDYTPQDKSENGDAHSFFHFCWNISSLLCVIRNLLHSQQNCPFLLKSHEHIAFTHNTKFHQVNACCL